MTTPEPATGRQTRGRVDAGSRPDGQARVAAICAELDVTPATARTFVSNYLGLLDARLERIDRELDALLVGDAAQTVRAQAGQTQSAEAALLSLEASSTMLGAYDVSSVSRQLRREIESGRLAAAAGRRGALHRAARNAERELRSVAAQVDRAV